MLTSLDGYTEDEHGGFGWGAPDEEVQFQMIVCPWSSAVENGSSRIVYG